jgi:hypothetical protein
MGLLSKKCKWAKKVWRELGLKQIRGDLSFLLDAKQCVDCILALSADQSSQVALLLNN